MTPDLVNGLFEFLGGCLLWTSVRRAYRDKQFKGVAILPTAFFAAWGAWNLYFYPHLGQWWSFAGGINVLVANTVWVGQMVWYSWLKPSWTYRVDSNVGCIACGGECEGHPDI